MQEEWQTLEYSSLDKFTEEFSAKFGKVMDSNLAYEEYGPVGETKIAYHLMFGTDGYNCKNDAEMKLIEKIVWYAQSIIPENQDYKHYLLSWRFRPKIEYEKDGYKGYARFFIVAEG